MKKNSEITPWSFYRNEPQSEQLPPADTPFPLPHAPPLPPFSQQKDFQKRNIAHISHLASQKHSLKPNSLSTLSLQSYCPIINTSAELIETRDQTTTLHNRYVILVSILETLKMETRNVEVKKCKEKYECLFPILRPRESLKLKKYKNMRAEYPSQMLFHELVNSIPDFS